jgi:uncharacterized membrane protein YeiH
MYWIEIIGTFAFAISGIRLAASKQFDLFGLFIVGFVTAVCGGTIRDVLLGVRPFLFDDLMSLLIVAGALVLYYFFHKLVDRIAGTIFLFDTIGLAIFTLLGMTKALDMGCSAVIAVVIGTMTGAGGGVLRDIFINEEPLIFRKEIYALACVAGGIVYFLLEYFNLGPVVYRTGCVAGVIIIRLLATKYHWQLPKVNLEK